MDARIDMRWLMAALIFALGCGGSTPPPDATVETKVESSSDPATKAPPVETVEPPREPATVDVAAKLLDLRKFPMPEGAKPMARPTLGTLMYDVKDNMKSAYDFASKGLLAAGWKKMPG